LTGQASPRPVRLAIIGMGRWGQVLVNAVQGRSETVRFTHGTTRTPAKSAGFAARQNIVMLDDLAAVLAEPSIDGVVLATPHSEHVGQIRAAAAAGKHVFCEKPLALTLADGAAAFDAAETAGVHLCVGHNRRFLPSYRMMAERLAEIGPVLQMIGNFSWGATTYQPGAWRSSRAESPAGGMTGLGIHMADAMVGLGLRASSVSVATRRAAPEGLEDTVTALIEAGPAVGVLTTMLGPGRFWRLDVFGAKGRMALDGETRFILQRAGGPEEVTDFGATDIEAAEIEAFAAVIRDQGRWPVSRSDALEGLALFEAICEAARTGPGREEQAALPRR